MEDKTYTYVFYDILDKVLQLSENPSQFAEFLSHQIRELIGTRTVVIAIKTKTEQAEIFSVFPNRKKEWANQTEILQLAELSFHFEKIEILDKDITDKKIASLLQILNIEKTIAIPLIAANRTVGSILLLDIMDLYGIDSVINLLTRLSGVFALIIRNSVLYHNLEDQVAIRTEELKKRNNELIESELQLKSVNEELSLKIDNIEEINIKLEETKSRAEEKEEMAKIIAIDLNKAQSVAKVGSWKWYIQENRLFCSSEMYKIFGLSEDIFTGNLLEIMQQAIHPDDKDKADAAIHSVLEKGISVSLEYRIILPDGTIKVLWSETGELIKDKNSEPLILSAVVQDITERKKGEEELIKAKEKAEESDRLKTAFLQNMSHEIRTPMNAIIGFSGFLNKPELSDEKRKSFTKIIINNTNQLLSIVTDILTISAVETKQEKVNIQTVCINNIIVELLSIFKTQAYNKNISLFAKQQLTDKQSEIYTDNTKVTQILTNLITNALKFTHNGYIEFGYTLVETQNFASVVTETQNFAPVVAETQNFASLQQMQFYVKDTGIGISKDQQEKIFERFRQADMSITKKYGGTGLGLSISKGFSELLDGKIWVESEPNKGSTFYFSIPYNPVQNSEISKTKANKNRKTILVAEDEEFNFLLIEEMLINMDFTIIHAKEGKEAVEIFKSNPNIDLILMDIKMPFMDGHTAALIIKEIKPNLPIIAQSAYALEHEIENYRNNAFDDYIIKPINEAELKQKVLKYIENH